tara:strand:+ start:165 stop:650 length:486 start_codon:yes stop_codon:yes gene_type:complete
MELSIEEIPKKGTAEENDNFSKILEESADLKVIKNDENLIIQILHLAGIPLEHIEQINGTLIPRDILISREKYKNVKEFLVKLKKIKNFSSSYLTSLHEGAEIKQKWPLLNLVRQILKVQNYRMKPVRKSAGKTKDGKKKYVRYFMIEKYREITKTETENI